MASKKFYAQTERLTLRTPTSEDTVELAKLRSTDFVMRYNLYKECDAEQIMWELENYEHILLIESKADKIIGCISLRDDPVRYHVDSVSLHAWLIEEKAYNGYMAEAIREIIPVLFLKYKIISVQIFSENTASIALAKKLGFKQEGFIRKAVKNANGQIFDLVLMSIEKSDDIKI